MAESLKDKVTAALKEAVGDYAHLQLDDEPNDRLLGLLLSDTFACLSPTERQDLIWKHLDAHLTVSERARVVFIVTDTPAEYESLKRAAND